ncbi:hypothetical protein CPLU01_04312 [Colletotrichum plurivorum]|uniref:Uncharacterized protein n=1 Tax=Colletotrichum plurivorum TaxID=2175906 RepID=A0A8H6NK46_9PEZI|nr:hypothetical protein CPLU01_04312 [Colletotrichum plurivorum]
MSRTRDLPVSSKAWRGESPPGTRGRLRSRALQAAEDAHLMTCSKATGVDMLDEQTVHSLDQYDMDTRSMVPRGSAAGWVVGSNLEKHSSDDDGGGGGGGGGGRDTKRSGRSRGRLCPTDMRERSQSDEMGGCNAPWIGLCPRS